jgi:bla regulator protein blaR1
MDILLPLAAKSLLIAGVTLLLLKVARRRSAADRSWIAHLGLAALIALPLALLLPQLQVETPWLGSPQSDAASAVAAPSAPRPVEAAPPAATFPGAQGNTPQASTGFWLGWLYLAPAALLLLFTLIALLRLVALQARASVLVEPNWLTALARAQRKMGFKHGTALLTSDELRSPISWGLLRPVILLNSAAVAAHREAEAIIAHELAHVKRLDWAKLLVSRVAVALFWFNPLVWLLAREAHQLREEAADDAVLEAEVEDTEYARLLIGVARHECRGLLLGAHGVAPGRTSLARRVQRVLDTAARRAPGGWRWTAAAGFFAAGVAVPMAALQLVPAADARPRQAPPPWLPQKLHPPLRQALRQRLSRSPRPRLPPLLRRRRKPLPTTPCCWRRPW